MEGLATSLRMRPSRLATYIPGTAVAEVITTAVSKPPRNHMSSSTSQNTDQINGTSAVCPSLSTTSSFHDSEV